jgi:hypothetical protein
MIKHYGFGFPPVGIINALEQTAPPDTQFYVLNPFGEVELPYHELDSTSYVIITTQEGSSHRWFDRLIPTLNKHGIDNTHIIIRSSCLWDPDSPVNHIHTIVDACSDFVSGIENYQPNVNNPIHHFVCQNRGHRWQRYRLVKTLLDRDLGNQGHITYIQLPVSHDPRFVALSKPDITWHEYSNINEPAVQGALFNVICETAYEPLPGSDMLTHHYRPGLTEKSYKCFAMNQIPVWLAPYRAVACYRNLGFDVFDDVVDHAYDLESDPVKRIEMVADQVQKLCSFSLSDLCALKQKFFLRFQHNWKNLNWYAHNFATEIPQWQQLFLRNNIKLQQDFTPH